MFTWPKRILFFVITNLLVLTTLSILFSIVQSYFQLDLSGYTPLLIFSVIFGMGGSLISLLASKFMAKQFMRVQVIEPTNTSQSERWLVNKVYEISKRAGLNKMPEVGIYDSPEINAFATGPSRNNSLVAVSTGLLNSMNEEELEGVLAHEVAHVANGDMVTMTLLQGIINTFVIFFARIIARIISSQDNERSYFKEFLLIMFFQTVFTLLGSILVNFFSRYREYRADAGSAKIVGKHKMIQALRALQNVHNPVIEDHQAISSLKISGSSKSVLAFLFSTHPPLESRIARLQGKG